VGDLQLTFKQFPHKVGRQVTSSGRLYPPEQCYERHLSHMVYPKTTFLAIVGIPAQVSLPDTFTAEAFVRLQGFLPDSPSS
jgi:hypothetical protein